MVRPLEPADLMMLKEQGDLQPEQVGFSGEITWPYAKHLRARGGGMVGTAANRVVCACGVLEKWPGTGFAWSLFTTGSGVYFQEITNHTKKYLNNCPFPRIELLVKAQFRNGHRYARILGFTLEAEIMRKWAPDGGDYALYAMVR